MADMADDIADCSGLSWSELATKLDLKSLDHDEKIQVSVIETSKGETDSMKLKKEEMTLYGLCPAQDEFFLVICECCHLLIKPQALQYHMDVRHRQYSSSQPSHCAVTLTTVGPVTQNFSSDRTSSFLSAPSTNSIADKQHIPGLEKSKVVMVKSKIKPNLKMYIKSGPNKQKPSVQDTQTGICFNTAVEAGIMDYVVTNKEPGASSACSLNSATQPIGTVSCFRDEKLLDWSISSKGLFPVIKGESKNVDDAVIVEPTHLKISEEQEALVKLLESNEWCADEGKPENSHERQERLLSEVATKNRHQEANQLKNHLSDTKGGTTGDITTALVSAVTTTTLTTSTCNLSKLSNTMLVSTVVRQSTGLMSRKNVTSAKTGLLSPTETSLGPLTGSQLSFISCPAVTAELATTTRMLRVGGIATSGMSSSETLTDSVTATSEKQFEKNLMSQALSQDVVKSEVCLSRASVDFSSTPASNVISNKVLLKSTKGRKSPSKFLLCKDREFDPDKHCGVWIDDIQKQCTRSLTCKSHSLNLRRAVPGRCKLFDQLLSEQRERKQASPKVKVIKRATKLKEKAATSNDIDRLTLCGNSPKKSILNFTSLSSGIAHSDSTFCRLQSNQTLTASQLMDKPKKPISVSSLSRSLQLLSSPRGDSFQAFPGVCANDDGVDIGEKDETGLTNDGPIGVTAFGYCTMSHQPHPIAVNGFNSSLHGRGCYVFNRKEDVYRTAFLAAIEAHLHPPPHKKLCLESKLPADVSSTPETRDPYDFLLVDGSSLAKYQITLSSPFNSVQTNGKQKQKNCHFSKASAQTAKDYSLSTSSVSLAKQLASDILENKQKFVRISSTETVTMPAVAASLSSSELTQSVSGSLCVSASSSGCTVAAEDSVESIRLMLPTDIESTTIRNGQLVGLPISEVVAMRSQAEPPVPPNLQITQNSFMSSPPPNLNKLPATSSIAKTLVPSQNVDVNLELQQVCDTLTLGTETCTTNASYTLALDSNNRRLVHNESAAVSAKLPVCHAVIRNLVKTTSSLITTKIPNIVLTSTTLPNGALKLAQRNKSVKGILNSTNQHDLTTVIGLNTFASGKLASSVASPQHAIISALGKSNQLTVSLEEKVSQKQPNILSKSSMSLQVDSTIITPSSQVSCSGFNSTTSTGRQFILTGSVRQIYTGPVSSSLKKPLSS